MENEIDIKMADMAIGNDDAVLKTAGIGSCLVVILYDKHARIGGMAHAMLPTRDNEMNQGDESSVGPKAKYVDQAIDNLIEGIINKGGQKENLVAKLVGGAKMFKSVSGEGHTIGEQNIEAARSYLEHVGIPVKKEDVGGTVGRLAEFHLDNGIVEVSSKM